MGGFYGQTRTKTGHIGPGIMSTSQVTKLSPTNWNQSHTTSQRSWTRRSCFKEVAVLLKWEIKTAGRCWRAFFSVYSFFEDQDLLWRQRAVFPVVESKEVGGGSVKTRISIWNVSFHCCESKYYLRDFTIVISEMCAAAAELFWKTGCQWNPTINVPLCLTQPQQQFQL